LLKIPTQNQTQSRSDDVLVSYGHSKFFTLWPDTGHRRPDTPGDICARQHICYSAYMLSSVRLSVCLSVCLSVTRVDQSKTLEVRIMQLSPPGSPTTLSFLTVNFTAKFQGEHR